MNLDCEFVSGLGLGLELELELLRVEKIGLVKEDWLLSV